MNFKKAVRSQLKLRMAIDGPSGSGKTYTALRFAFALGKRVAVIDTEHGAASKYAGEAPDGVLWEFDACELNRFSPTDYASAVEEAGRLGYDAIVIDSLSHAWTGEGGALDMWEKAGGKFQSWKSITPLHNKMIEAILRSPAHVIATMRSKTDYVLEEEQDGNRKKVVPRKVGMAPIQRNGTEYEFDLYGSLDLNHILTITKTRCSALDSEVAARPGADFMRPAIEWLNTGEPAKVLSEAGETSAAAESVDEIAAKLREKISKLRRKLETLLKKPEGDDSDLEGWSAEELRSALKSLETEYVDAVKRKIEAYYRAIGKLEPKTKTPDLNGRTIEELERICSDAHRKWKSLQGSASAQTQAAAEQGR